MAAYAWLFAFKPPVILWWTGLLSQSSTARVDGQAASLSLHYRCYRNVVWREAYKRCWFINKAEVGRLHEGAREACDDSRDFSARDGRDVGTCRTECQLVVSTDRRVSVYDEPTSRMLPLLKLTLWVDDPTLAYSTIT